MTLACGQPEISSAHGPARLYSGSLALWTLKLGQVAERIDGGSDSKTIDLLEQSLLSQAAQLLTCNRGALDCRQPFNGPPRRPPAEIVTTTQPRMGVQSVVGPLQRYKQATSILNTQLMCRTDSTANIHSRLVSCRFAVFLHC